MSMLHGSWVVNCCHCAYNHDNGLTSSVSKIITFMRKENVKFVLFSALGVVDISAKSEKLRFIT